MDLKELFHPKFFEVFSEDELKEIYEKSCCGDYSCYIIFNEKQFPFELSANLGDELKIYCDEYESNETCEPLQTIFEAHFLRD